jgi:cytochrome P450
MLDDIDLCDLDRFAEGVPHEWFDRLRREAPVHWHEEATGPGFWVVTRHEEVSALNRDWKRFSSAAGITPKGQGADQELGMLTMDPPRQTRYRAAMSSYFMPRAIEKLETRVRAAARELVEGFIARGGGDFVEEVAAPFPVRVICDWMGVAREHEADVYRWSNAVVPNQDPEYWVSPEHAEEASRAFDAFADELVAAKRERPGDDLATALVRARFDDRPLDGPELRAFVRLLVVGGAETTRHLISHALLALTRNPEQRARFASGRVDAAVAVEEMLRFSSPVMHHARWATQDVEVAGRKIRAGDRVTLWMVSANRDAAVFRNPHELDLGRQPNHHVALGGGGPHFCLGAHLARLEARVVLEELRPHLEDLELAEVPAVLRSSFFHGIKHLSMKVDRSGS